jgi:hypothetical protein
MTILPVLPGPLNDAVGITMCLHRHHHSKLFIVATAVPCSRRLST